MSDRPVTTWRTVQRIVLPDDAVPPGTRDLYVRAEGEVEILGRTSLRLAANARVSFGTYFGGLPRVAWTETAVDRLRLSLRIDGAVRIRVLGTDAGGTVRELADRVASGDWAFDLPLDERSAGWIWFEAEATESAILHDARWSAPEPTRPDATVSIAITTFNRADDCVSLIARLASDPTVKDRILQVVVADQGTQRIRSHPGFAEAAASWGDELRVIEQDNLGGSGGFSRGMLEAGRTAASHVLLLDDDVNLEPESIMRMLARVEHAPDEPLIGAHMLRLTEPTRLHSWGERLDRRRFWWEPVHPELAGLDLAVAGPDRLPILSEPCPVDFNGWWMCLIPVSVIQTEGASLPLFIKWDDAEYGLRAAENGHATITLPGAALWHVPWTAKDDGLDWQAYYQLRNRLVAALIHSPHRRGGSLLRDVLALDVNHVLCLQYGSAAVRRLAMRDVLGGPEHLVPGLRSAPGRVRSVLAEEGQTLKNRDGLSVAETVSLPVAPRGAAASAGRLLRVLSHQLRRSPRATELTPERTLIVLRREHGKWWSLGLVDEAFLQSAAGVSGFLLRRDRRAAARHLLGAGRAVLELWWKWPALARRYRADARSLSSAETWSSVFDDS
ncbi:MAG: glycosyltransferase [Microbacterium sp.]|jgi:galactofuranosylgalactofuranosylrhamnosyl-N-acetylglucosaminyl-diphospho-decaprenol beta-1,5/1,6-galactofuranosyltransferase|uniref:glycosyltransferase n=1 Tax=Microbacterium sp. TaxID=51671 RepID=UPI00282AC71C|nr:glycosyltransferase [Microbacterium sp.]MDR2323363.1 glycosyltransferase [Microbacterium sp.]